MYPMVDIIPVILKQSKASAIISVHATAWYLGAKKRILGSSWQRPRIVPEHWGFFLPLDTQLTYSSDDTSANLRKFPA